MSRLIRRKTWVERERERGLRAKGCDTAVPITRCRAERERDANANRAAVYRPNLGTDALLRVSMRCGCLDRCRDR